MWEYKNVTTVDPNEPFAKLPTFSREDLTAMLESYGNAGWELVCVTPVSSVRFGQTNYLIFFFKRPK
jgi:Domain of unknown function (DUF4177)